MTAKYTKDVLIEALLENQKCSQQFMERINSSLEALNDNNVLHKQAIDINTKATQEMITAIKVQSTYLKLQSKYIKYITITLLVAIVVLAGAEKALKFIPIFK